MVEAKTFRSPMRLDAMVAAMTPTATGHRAERPSAIKMPEEIPAAGQNTATPGGVIRSRLRRAVRE
jgi:hypothetical protein